MTGFSDFLFLQLPGSGDVCPWCLGLIERRQLNFVFNLAIKFFLLPHHSFAVIFFHLLALDLAMFALEFLVDSFAHIDRIFFLIFVIHWNFVAAFLFLALSSTHHRICFRR